jgi:hypothetical protein
MYSAGISINNCHNINNLSYSTGAGTRTAEQKDNSTARTVPGFRTRKEKKSFFYYLFALLKTE